MIEKENLTGKIVVVCPHCNSFWVDNNSITCPVCGNISTPQLPFNIHFVYGTFHSNTRGVFYDAVNNTLIELRMDYIRAEN